MTTPGALELARLLARLVADAGLKPAEIARRVGKSEAMVSRYLHGKTVPKPDVARAIARAAGATSEAVEESGRLAEDLASPRVVLLRPGTATSQRRWREAEAQTDVVLEFAGLIVPGLLQTETYARAVFVSGGQTGSDLEDNVRQRLERAAALDDPAHRFVEVMTEGALRHHVVGPQVMLEQCEHIAARARTDDSGRVRVGIIPWTRPGRLFPMTNFSIHDDRVAIVGTDFGTAYITRAVDVAAYTAQHGQLGEWAVFGEACAREVERIAEEYRALL